MDRRIVAINNWVTAIYFKKPDIETFSETYRVL